MTTIIQGVCDSFRTDLLSAAQDFTSDVFKIALYGAGSNLTPTITAYTTTGEIVTTGYTAGGLILQNVTVTQAVGASWVDFDDAVWTGATSNWVTSGALIYNASRANKSVCVLSFGNNRFATAAGTFTVKFPPGAPTTALIRLQ